MQLIEAALAFAITMLALSLVVSSFVEIIHRICSMREAGLKYMLGQMLDQVLDEHIRSGIAPACRPTRRSQRPTERQDQRIGRKRAQGLCRTHERQPRADGGDAESDAATASGGDGASVVKSGLIPNSLVHFWKNSVVFGTAEILPR